MRKINLLITTLVLVILAVAILDKTVIKKGTDLDLTQRIYSYMTQDSKQRKVFNAAIVLNDNKTSNACVYFVSEVLRKNNIPISKQVANTSQLISALKEKGWKKDTDYKNLQRGNIVFTTDEEGNKKGVPSHVFVFMGWVKEGSYDNAYICDNQAKDYNNEIYHIRNIKDRANVNGITKDAFSFFLKP